MPYNALALLRPTCEDLFFLGLLLELPRDEANRYIVEKSRLETHEGLLAQAEFFPKKRERFNREVRSRDTELIARLDKAVESQKKVLKALGVNLGWGASAAPRVKYMAEKADLAAEYDFFYRGASSSVHASLHHLLRMVWGDTKEGVFSVSNTILEEYYARFAVIYGTWLMSMVVEIATRELPELEESTESVAYGIWLATLLVPAIEHEAPGIVTQEELRWDGPPLEEA